MGEVYFADLSPVVGSDQGGIRPVLVVSKNIMNKHSPFPNTFILLCLPPIKFFPRNSSWNLR